VTTPGVVLDAGAFVAIERGDHVIRRTFARYARVRTPLVTSAAVVAQVWRGGAGAQTAVALVLSRTQIVPLEATTARVIGTILGRTKTSDPIDAHVVLLAKERDWPILTSDPDDLRAIDPDIVVERV
jgi:predicted nucleic acid-binding protein